MLVLSNAYLVFATDLLPTFGSVYSPHDEYRHQRAALLQGRFAIRYDPYGFPPDWAWANGLHQLWGLAVPILQLPFDVLARLVGMEALPDRLFLLAFHGIVTLVLYFALGRILGQMLGAGDPSTRRLSLLLQIVLTLFCVLHTSFLALVHILFSIHREALVYSSLWGILLLALTLSLFATRSLGTYLILCLLSGWFLALWLALYLGLIPSGDHAERRAGTGRPNARRGAGPATTFFFSRTPCIDLSFTFDSPANRDANLPAIEVQLNGERALASPLALDHQNIRYAMRFCASGTPRFEDPRASRYSMAVITWNAAERFAWSSGALLHEVKAASP